MQHLGHLGHQFLLFFSGLWTTLSQFLSWLWISFSCSFYSYNLWLYIRYCRDCKLCDLPLKSVVFCSSRELIWQDSNSVFYGGQQLKILLSSFSLLAICFLPGSLESLVQICSSGISQGLGRIYMQMWGSPFGGSFPSVMFLLTFQSL